MCPVGGHSDCQRKNKAARNLQTTDQDTFESHKHKRTWKKEASTSLRQSILKTRPMILTDTTGTNDLATRRSNTGISIFEVKNAPMCSSKTADTSWRRRNKSGTSGADMRTALLLGTTVS